MEKKIVKKVCRCQQFSSDLSRKLYEHCKIGKYCDYSLKTEKGDEFKVHKNVLEAVCPFFETMFNSGLNDNNAESVVIKRCSSNVLEKIIQFMYTGEAEITSDIAREVLDTALFLGLMPLVDTCTEILVEVVDSSNCFELLAYSETYFTSESLGEKCMQTICENFEMLKNSPDFYKMSIDGMKKLSLCDRKLCNDEQLYLAIVDWIKYDLENRDEFIAVLLDRIQFEEISIEFGISNILTDDLLWRNWNYVSKVNEIMRGNWTGQLEKNKNQRIFFKPEIENLYTVISDEILSYGPGLKPFTTKVTKIDANGIRCGYSTFGDKNLLVCGGSLKDETITNTCNYYSFNEDCWKSLPPMEIARDCHRAITLDNKIYVCGGWNEKTVEIFDINETKWMRGPSLDQNRAYMGLCSHNKSIYAAHESSLQFLDTRLEIWTELPSLSQSLKRIRSAISYKDFIYGFALDGIFTFDIRRNKWLENSTSYKEVYSTHSPLTCMVGNEIYVFAIHNESNIYMLHSYDASNLSMSDFHLIKLTLNNLPCYGLFSL